MFLTDVLLQDWLIGWRKRHLLRQLRTKLILICNGPHFPSRKAQMLEHQRASQDMGLSTIGCRGIGCTIVEGASCVKLYVVQHSSNQWCCHWQHNDHCWSTCKKLFQYFGGKKKRIKLFVIWSMILLKLWTFCIYRRSMLTSGLKVIVMENKTNPQC